MSIAKWKKRRAILPVDTVGYCYTATIADSATGESIPIPPLRAGQTVGITTIAGASTGKMQITMSSDEAIIAGTANWVDSTGTFAVITGSEQDGLAVACTGIRFASTSGTFTVECVL